MGANHSVQIDSCTAIFAFLLSPFFPWISVVWVDGCGLACFIEIILWSITYGGGWYEYQYSDGYTLGYALPVTMIYAWIIICIDMTPVSNTVYIQQNQPQMSGYAGGPPAQYDLATRTRRVSRRQKNALKAARAGNNDAQAEAESESDGEDSEEAFAELTKSRRAQRAGRTRAVHEEEMLESGV